MFVLLKLLVKGVVNGMIPFIYYFHRRNRNLLNRNTGSLFWKKGSGSLLISSPHRVHSKG